MHSVELRRRPGVARAPQGWPYLHTLHVDAAAAAAAAPAAACGCCRRGLPASMKATLTPATANGYSYSLRTPCILCMSSEKDSGSLRARKSSDSRARKPPPLHAREGRRWVEGWCWGGRRELWRVEFGQVPSAEQGVPSREGGGRRQVPGELGRLPEVGGGVLALPAHLLPLRAADALGEGVLGEGRLPQLHQRRLHTTAARSEGGVAAAGTQRSAG